MYTKGCSTFKVNAKPEPVFTIPVVKEGRAALEKINKVGGRGRGGVHRTHAATKRLD